LTNKNKIIRAPDANVACVDSITPPILSRREINIGIEPSISITANKVKLTVNISFDARSEMEGITNFWQR